MKPYNAANLEKKREYLRKYYQANREKKREYLRKYYQANREKKREYQRKYCQANREKLREYQRKYCQANREKLRERQRKYYQANREKLREYQRKYCQANPEKLREYQRKYCQANPEKLRERARKWKQERLREDPKFRLDENFSSQIRGALKEKKQGRHWEKLVEYTLKDLILHLEQKFDKKMTWSNYGRYWHVDHYIPKSWFQYESAESPEFKKCWALTNLQPLSGSENIKKNNRYIG